MARPLVLAALLLFFATACSGEEQESDEPSPNSTANSDMPASPVTDRLVTCLADAGWEATRSWTGGLDFPSVPADQQDQFQTTLADCEESSGWVVAQNLDANQIRELYEQEVEAHECFESIGVDSAEPPSEQVYIDTYASADQYYAFQPGFDSLSSGQMQEAVQDCPPPTWFLNISGLG